MIYAPKPYQQLAYRFLLNRFTAPDLSPRGAGLLLDPGLGKTSITLWTYQTLRDFGEVRQGLIVAPLRVCRSVWPAETKKWGFDVKIQPLLGTAPQRRRALAEPADLYVINPEGLAWLATQNLDTANAPKFDVLILDESTKFKNWGTKRHKHLRKLLPRFSHRLILTGTPSPNGLGDLFAQVYTLDDGMTLGKSRNYFNARYMTKGGFKGRVWSFDESQTEKLHEAISPMVLRLSAEEHLDMPELVDNVIRVQLPGDVMKEYRRLERELFMELAGGVELTASSAGAMYSICKGIANGGAYYGPDKQPAFVHDTKVEALADLLEELNGKNLLVAYAFKHDLERIQQHSAFKKAPVVAGGVSADETDRIVGEWNEGRHRALLVQPQAMSHGLNMQQGGADVAWFGLTDQLEVYQQFNARLYRQGQEHHQVRIHHIIAEETVDEAIYARLHEKAGVQQSLLEALDNYRKSKETLFT